MARIVIVGAGIAGLSAAAWLADFGHDVLVFEAAAGPGGQVTEWIDSAPGALHIGLGPTAFTLPAVFRDLFRKTGRPLERVVGLVPVDPAVRYVFPDGVTVDVPNASRAGAVRAFDSALADGVGPSMGTQWDAVIEHGNRLWEQLRPVVLGYLGRETSGGQAARARGRRSPGLDARSAQLLRDVAADGRLRAVLDSYAAAVGEYPARAPASLTALPYLEQTFGLWTVDGGLGRLVDALHRRAEERGATVRYGVRATGVAVAGGRVEGVQLADDQTVPADVVVWTASPSLLGNDVLGSTTPPAQSALRRLLPRPPRTADEVPPTAGRSILTVLLVPDATEPAGATDPGEAIGLGEAAGPGRPGPTRAVRPGHAVGADAPLRTVLVPGEGRATVIVHRGPEFDSSGRRAWVLHADCPPHGATPGALDWADAGTVETHVAELAEAAKTSGIGLGGPATVRHVRTPRDLEKTIGAPGGCVHGRPATDGPGPGRTAGRGAGEQVTALVRRPANTTQIRGLFLAGAGAHPGPGVPMAAISASIVADLVGRA